MGNSGAAGRDTCSYDGFAFFAGRGVPDFGQFISSAAQCGSQATVIGDDDVTRFGADQGERQRSRTTTRRSPPRRSPSRRARREGVTGTIDYGGDISRNVPQNKPVAVMGVAGGEVDKSVHDFCGAADGPTSDTWCPPDPWAPRLAAR